MKTMIFKLMSVAHLNYHQVCQSKMPLDNRRMHSFGSEPFIRPANKDAEKRLAAVRQQ